MIRNCDDGSKNLSLPFWKHDRFSMEEIKNNEYISEFRFEKKYLFLLHCILQITDWIRFYNGTVVSGIESLYIRRKRYIYLSSYLEMISRFRRVVEELYSNIITLRTINQAPGCPHIDSSYSKVPYMPRECPWTTTDDILTGL